MIGFPISRETAGDIWVGLLLIVWLAIVAAFWLVVGLVGFAILSFILRTIL